MHLLVLGAFCHNPGASVSQGHVGLNAPCGAGCFLTLRAMGGTRRSQSLNAPSGAGCFLTSPTLPTGTGVSLNAPCGAGCFLALSTPDYTTGHYRLNAPSGAGCFLTPASGRGVVASLPGAGAPPAPQAPCGTGQQCPYLTTFRRPDAKRHRRHLRHLQPPASDDVKPKGRRSCL